MIVLSNVSSSVEVVLTGAAATTELPWVSHWLDVTTADQSLTTIGETDGVTIGATGVTVVAAPAAGHTRTLKSFTLYNGDTTGAKATVRFNNGVSTRIMVSPLLAVGDTLEYSSDD